MNFIRRNPVSSPAAAQAEASKRVLVIQLGEMADFVRALAPASRIRDHHLGARITLLTTEATRELAEKCPYFDMIEADGRPKEPPAITKLIARIRAAKYDMIYDLDGSSRTNNYFQGMRPWPPQWSGPVAGCSHPFLDPARHERHPLDRYAMQLDAAGLSVANEMLPDLSWVRAVLRDPPRLQPEYFGLRGPYVLITPRGAEAEPKRRWPQEKYIELARRIAHGGVTPVVLGAQAERALGAAIVKAEPRAKNLVTRPDMFQIIALAERAAFAVGDDVELMHIAAAAGAPSLTLLSSLARPDQAAPRGKGGVIALTAAVVADIPVEQAARQLLNCGVYRQAQTA